MNSSYLEYTISCDVCQNISCDGSQGFAKDEGKRDYFRMYPPWEVGKGDKGGWEWYPKTIANIHNETILI